MFGEAAHLADERAEPVEVGIECLERMVWRSSARKPPSAVAAGDVVAGAVVDRVGEDRGGLVELDQLAEVEEGGVVCETRAACCMLWVTMTIV